MRSIQDVGIEILKDNPASFYIFAGTEYGIKCRYIDHLKEYYHGNYEEYQTVNDVLQKMRKKQLIPLQDTLYVVRYDTEFINSLDKNTDKRIKNTNIKGTLVCIYEDLKQVSKLEKYLDDYIVFIDDVNPKFVNKYLREDFPEISDRLAKIATKIGNNYGQSKNIAYSMTRVSESKFDALLDTEIYNLFGVKEVPDSIKIQNAVAAKNFNYLCMILSDKEKNYDDVIYTTMDTMLELEKILCSKYSNSPLVKYKNLWSKSEVYNMYCHCYQIMYTMRYTTVDSYNLLIYLFALLKFSRVPSLKEIQTAD